MDAATTFFFERQRAGHEGKTDEQAVGVDLGEIEAGGEHEEHDGGTEAVGTAPGADRLIRVRGPEGLPQVPNREIGSGAACEGTEDGDLLLVRRSAAVPVADQAADGDGDGRRDGRLPPGVDQRGEAGPEDRLRPIGRGGSGPTAAQVGHHPSQGKHGQQSAQDGDDDAGQYRAARLVEIGREGQHGLNRHDALHRVRVPGHERIVERRPTVHVLGADGDALEDGAAAVRDVGLRLRVVVTVGRDRDVVLGIEGHVLVHIGIGEKRAAARAGRHWEAVGGFVLSPAKRVVRAQWLEASLDDDLEGADDSDPGSPGEDQSGQILRRASPGERAPQPGGQVAQGQSAPRCCRLACGSWLGCVHKSPPLRYECARHAPRR